eukprot:Hpha_TRINITY_DN16821_c1_g9::TRINITY_DN16821_c1_g9_i2::g.153789::m.153789
MPAGNVYVDEPVQDLLFACGYDTTPEQVQQLLTENETAAVEFRLHCRTQYRRDPLQAARAFGKSQIAAPRRAPEPVDAKARAQVRDIFSALDDTGPTSRDGPPTTAAPPLSVHSQNEPPSVQSRLVQAQYAQPQPRAAPPPVVSVPAQGIPLVAGQPMLGLPQRVLQQIAGGRPIVQQGEPERQQQQQQASTSPIHPPISRPQPPAQQPKQQQPPPHQPPPSQARPQSQQQEQQAAQPPAPQEEGQERQQQPDQEHNDKQPSPQSQPTKDSSARPSPAEPSQIMPPTGSRTPAPTPGQWERRKTPATASSSSPASVPATAVAPPPIVPAPEPPRQSQPQPEASPQPPELGRGGSLRESFSNRNRMPPVDAPPPVKEGDGKEYFGRVKSFSHDSGYGFIECQQLHSVHGVDVWAHWKQLEADDCLTQGTMVIFKYCFGKQGRPQARDVRKYRPGEAEDESIASGGPAGGLYPMDAVISPPVDPPSGDRQPELREDPSMPPGSQQYTIEQFIHFYGVKKGRRYWERALIGKYPDRPPAVGFSPVSPRGLDKKQSRGARVGDYEVGAVIGEGTFSTVRSAVDKRTGREVAMKIIRKKGQAGKTPRDAEDVNSEAALLHHLTKPTNPNIVSLLETMESSDCWFLVLEAVKGGDLMKKVREADGKRLTDADSRNFFVQLVRALAACHAVQIAHRDVRPENCLITREGVLKLADFGCSAWFRDPDVDGTTDCNVGTCHYCAPEVLAIGYNPYRADCWSAGCVLYEVMAGAGQYAYGQRGMSEKEVEDVLKRGKVNRCPPHIGDQARDVINSLLNTEPDSRASMAEVLRMAFCISDGSKAGSNRRVRDDSDDEHMSKRQLRREGSNRDSHRKLAGVIRTGRGGGGGVIGRGGG